MFQRKGIGTDLLKRQLKIDLVNNRNTILQVFKENPARFLYQKVGFILEQSQEYHHVSDSFIDMCRTRGAIYTKHLTMTENSNFYLCKWKLYVPKNCVTENNKEEYELI